MNYVKVPYDDWIAICDAVRTLANTQQLYVSSTVSSEIEDTIDTVNYILTQVVGG